MDDNLRTLVRGFAFGALSALTGGISEAFLEPTVDERLDPKFHSAIDMGKGTLSVAMTVIGGAPTVGGPTLAPKLVPQVGGVAVAAEVAWSTTGTGALVLGAIGIATTTGSGGTDPPKETLGEQIAEGHAFDTHVVKKGEFAEFGITTKEDFATHIDKVVSQAKGPNVRKLSGGRSAYWDDATGTVVIRNPKAADMGTAFRPDRGRTYFTNLK